MSYFSGSLFYGKAVAQVPGNTVLCFLYSKKRRLVSCNRKSVRNSYGCNINMDSNLLVLFSSSVKRKHSCKKQKEVESCKYCKNKHRSKVDRSQLGGFLLYCDILT